MAECLIGSGVGISCADLRRVAGINKRAWAFNMGDLRTPIDPTASFITNLNFNSYALLFKFEGKKYTHSAEAKLVRSEDGNVSWEHTVTLKLNNTSYQDDAVLQDLAVSETGWIVQTNSREFLIYGAGNGMDMMEMTDPTGTKIGDSEVSTIVMKGSESSLPKRLILPASSQGDSFASTLYYLNALTNVNITA